jgi:CheY-like chemotaxis protein
MLATELIDVPGVGDVAPLRILVVDNTRCVGELIRHILIRVEHRVDVVGSTREALDMLERASYDVVIAEQYLGCRDITGCELARLVRHNWPATGFSLVTESLASITDASNVDAVLLKPFCVVGLREMVNRIGLRRSSYAMS